MSEPVMRESFGRALAEYGSLNQLMVVLDADSSNSTCSKYFADKFPDRFFNVGLATDAMFDLAAGMAMEGYLPVVNGLASHIVHAAFEQIHTSICQAGLNVKIVGASAGLSNIRDGAAFQSINDLALMRSLPGMTVIVPADARQAATWVPLICEIKGPVYLRISRAIALPVTMPGDRVSPGRAILRKEGTDVTIIATGLMVGRSLIAAVELEKESISSAVLEVHTIKPLDYEAILNAAKKSGAFAVVEEHSIIGGLGSAIAELIVETHPCPIVRVGIRDQFTGSAQSTDLLLDQVGLSINDIASAARKAFKAKKAG